MMNRPEKLAVAVAIVWASLPFGLAAQEPDRRTDDEHYMYVGADYSYATFAGELTPWHLLALTAGRGGPSGSFIARLNLARRFDDSGAQIEADAYPGLGENSYAYLNVGYSNADIFPQWRWGAEVYRSLPNAFEASLGVRQLRFGGDPVNLFTGSVGMYRGNYWFSLRPYVRDNEGAVSASSSITVRRYYQDSDNFIGGRLGYGTTPGDELTAVELARLSSTTAAGQWSRTIASRLIGSLTLTYDREEIAADRFRNRWEASAGARVHF
jgi:YaiO family outer membrane protein